VKRKQRRYKTKDKEGSKSIKIKERQKRSMGLTKEA
jgi:hypothetical protein